MPLQQISLDQSIYNKQKPKWGSNVQGAGGVQGSQQRPVAGSTRDTSNRFVDEQKAKWAEQDKATKQQRDMQMQKAQEIGMQVANQIQKGQQQQQTQAMEAKKKVEADPEAAAQEMYNLMLTLPDEAKEQLLNQLFTPTSSGSSMSSGGKTINMPSKYNPLASVFLEKGWAMFDAKGNVNLSEPEKENEKGTFEKLDDNTLFNSKTGETKKINEMGEEDWDAVYNDIIDDAEGQVKGFLESTVLENVDPAERDKQMGKAKEYMKLIVSSRLVIKGMEDPDMVKRYADAAVGDFDWQGWLKSKNTGGENPPPEPTKRDDPFNEEVFGGLQGLYKEKPEVITNNLEKYYDLYGKANVDALFETKPKPEYKVPGNDFKKWSAL